MRLTAQRVISPSGVQGINAFCYLHGPYFWLDEPPPEISGSQGQLTNSHVEVPPPGNRVRSYLEILAPDETPSGSISKDVLDCTGFFERQSMPIQMQSGDTHFTFDIDGELAPAWHRELALLLRVALGVRAP